MAQINFNNRTLTGKIVYYGPGLAGKTTNLEAIYKAAPKAQRGKLTSIATSGDRTIFFDYLPLELGKVGELALTIALYTVPGQSYYAATRRLVLSGVDGVVFVADSSPDRLADNVASFDELQEELRRQGHSPRDVPMVVQWNKRDAPGALAIADLERALNPYRVPSFEATANRGEGVLKTLRAATKIVLRRLREQYSGDDASLEKARLETETHEPSDSIADDNDATPGVGAGSGSSPKHLPLDHKVGDAVGGCVILAKLGEGGMGSAYLARLKNNPKQTVVVKTMKPGREATQARVQRFFREARSAARLDHENVVKVEEVGTDERGMHYMIMQHVKGADLKTHVQERGRLEPYEAARIILEVAKALVATHKAGVIHRDVKPANVVIGENGDVKLIDFGLSRDLRLNDELTRSGGVVGTIMYMAPELFRGAEADQRVDVFSLGLTFYFLLTGRAPFSGCAANEVIGGLAKLKKPSDEADLPTGFRRVIEGMLSRDPALRYASADVVIRELEGLWDLEVPGDDESDGFWLWEPERGSGARPKRPASAAWSPAVLPDVPLEDGSDHFASQVVTALHAWDALDERSQAPDAASEEISDLIDQAWGDKGWSSPLGTPDPDAQLLEADWEGQLSDALAEIEAKPVNAHQRKRLSRDPGQALVDALLKRGPARGGTTRFKRGKLKQTIKDLTKEIKSNREHPQPWTKRGIARARGGDLNGAIGDYTHALEADPTYLPALANRASALFHLKQYKQAEKECTRTLKRAPRLAKAWLFRGISRAVLRRPGAREDMMRFLKLSPYSPRVGYIRKLLKEFDERSARQKKRQKRKKT